MRLGPVLFIATCLVAVFWLVLIVGAARGLPRAPNPGSASLSLAEGPAAGRDGVGAGLAEGPAGGMASSYGPGLYGNRLACGGRLWPSTHAVAHRTLKCGTPLRVCWRNRCQRLLVRDRGPFVWGRSLDLTEAAVRRFGFSSARRWGLQYVEWEVM